MGQFNPYTEWEMIVYIAFVMMLTYLPFHPFNYDAGPMVAQIVEQASQMVQDFKQEQQSGKKGKHGK